MWESDKNREAYVYMWSSRPCIFLHAKQNIYCAMNYETAFVSLWGMFFFLEPIACCLWDQVSSIAIGSLSLSSLSLSSEEVLIRITSTSTPVEDGGWKKGKKERKLNEKAESSKAN